jgi:hypothetical protein
MGVSVASPCGVGVEDGLASVRSAAVCVFACDCVATVGQLWGLAVHPSLEVAATAGDDNSVCLWDLTTHSLISSRQVSAV